MSQDNTSADEKMYRFASKPNEHQLFQTYRQMFKSRGIELPLGADEIIADIAEGTTSYTKQRELALLERLEELDPKNDWKDGTDMYYGFEEGVTAYRGVIQTEKENLNGSN